MVIYGQLVVKLTILQFYNLQLQFWIKNTTKFILQLKLKHVPGEFFRNQVISSFLETIV